MAHASDTCNLLTRSGHTALPDVKGLEGIALPWAQKKRTVIFGQHH